MAGVLPIIVVDSFLDELPVGCTVIVVWYYYAKFYDQAVGNSEVAECLRPMAATRAINLVFADDRVMLC